MDQASETRQQQQLNIDATQVDESNPAIAISKIRSWRQRFGRNDPEAQLKKTDTSGSSATPDSVFASGWAGRVNFKQRYDDFQEDFRRELLERQAIDSFSDAKLEYLTNKYLGRRYPVGDVTDPTFNTDGFITYFKQSTGVALERKLPVRGMTQDTDSFLQMEGEWIRAQSEQGEALTDTPDIKWIHLPANNMMWVQQAMLNILEFYHRSTPGDTVSGTRAREVRDNILQADYWQHRSNRSLEGKIWGRYMQPFSRCIQPISGEGDISPALNTPTLAVYMPYLHWERNGAAAYMRNVAQDVYEYDDISYRFEPDTTTGPIAQLSRYGASTDEKLLRRYLRCRQHLHIRHTLDQYFHPYLRDSSDRDFDQVVERYSRRYGLEQTDDFLNESPILMVDQLWLWVIGGDTILTCFPMTWGMAEGVNDPLDVRSKIMYNIAKPINHTCYSSATLLANIIINQCAANMLEPSMLVHERHKFLNFFEQSITILMERQTRSLKRLLCMSTPDRLEAHDKLLDTTEEFSMLTEGRDIEEELKIIRIVVERQEDAMKQFSKALYKYHLATSTDNVYSIDKLTMALQTRKRAIDSLSMAIKGVNEQILQLLGLKQQQASISEARTSRMLAQQGETQSASMMLFTVVTILFLPLSTMTSFFGVNSVDFGSGTLKLGIVSAYIFPISAACVGIAFFLGFNHQARRTLLMWLDYIAESLTGPDRNHFWAAREQNIKLRLKRKRKEKRAKLATIKRRRQQQLRAEDEDASSGDDNQPEPRLNPYRSRVSLRSSISLNFGAGDNLIDNRKLRPRAGSYSSSHIYTSGPDTEEEASDRPISPDSHLSPPRSARPSGTTGAKPLFPSGLVHSTDNEIAITDEHHNTVPAVSIQGPDLAASQPTTLPRLPSVPHHIRSTSAGRNSTLREETVRRAFNQAAQPRENRPTATANRRSFPDIAHLRIAAEAHDAQSGDDSQSTGRRESEPALEHESE